MQEQEKRMVRSILNNAGEEVPDPEPIEIPAQFLTRPSTLAELRRMFNIAQMEAAQSGRETFEEADDFDIPDEPVVASRWEIPADNYDAAFLTRNGGSPVPGDKRSSQEGGVPANSGVPSGSAAPNGNLGVEGGTPSVTGGVHMTGATKS